MKLKFTKIEIQESVRFAVWDSLRDSVSDPANDQAGSLKHSLWLHSIGHVRFFIKGEIKGSIHET